MSYFLCCPVCRGRFPDDGVRLICPGGCDSLLRTHYREPHAPLDESASGIGRYHRRLPGDARALTTALPVVLRIPWMSGEYPELDLRVLFSGWWPKHGARMDSGSFKDLEAAAVLARLRLRPGTILVLASAGNTAAAFATACTRMRVPCVIVVTEEALERIRIPIPQGPQVRVIAITGGAAYDDAIALSRTLAESGRFILEGGVRNVARRDGMGMALGVALEADPIMPDCYVQAIGSGAGAIAVFEAAENARLRLPYLGLPRLLLAQNAPYAPVTRSYARGSRFLLRDDEATARRQIAHLFAPVLSNLAPPYEAVGGLYSVLKRSGGAMSAVSNAEAREAWERFRAREGVELDGAAAVALASLAKLPPLRLPRRARVLLHLTGGMATGTGLPRIPLRPTMRINRDYKAFSAFFRSFAA
jgi:cysteate synthase